MLLPRDVTLRVEEFAPQTKTRTDVLESRKAKGTIKHSVEDAGNGTGLLVVEADLSIDGLGSITELPAVQRGIQESTQLLLEHLPEIIQS